MSAAAGRQNRRRLMVALGVWLLVLGCGRKAPPLPPLVIVPPSISDLKAETVGNAVQLTWSIPKKGDAPFEGIEGFRVFRYTARASASPCLGCPIPFGEFLELKLKHPDPARIEKGRVIFTDTWDAAYQYVYKVVVFHNSGGVSDDSNIVHVTAP